MTDSGEISTGRRWRSYAAVGLGALVVAMVVANHVVRGRPLTWLDLVFYFVIIGVALLVFDKEVFLTATREGRKFVPFAQKTQVSPVVQPPKDPLP